MQTVYHPADSRGHADHGWLNTHHSFSFANYYEPSRMGFGVLRVLNDDEVAAGRGFGSHPHRDMEIISIPLEGNLEHKDNMGNTTVIREGDIQVMSAGTGVVHSEKNESNEKDVKFLQIWVIPRARNLSPRYDQLSMATEREHNAFEQVLSPDKNDSGVWINQDAYFSIGRFDPGFEIDYQVKRQGNGVYLFMLEGEATVGDTELSRRDGLGLSAMDTFTLRAGDAGARVLLMEVPMA